MTPFLFISFRVKHKRKGDLISSPEFPYAHNSTKHQGSFLETQKCIRFDTWLSLCTSTFSKMEYIYTIPGFLLSSTPNSLVIMQNTRKYQSRDRVDTNSASSPQWHITIMFIFVLQASGMYYVIYRKQVRSSLHQST